MAGAESPESMKTDPVHAPLSRSLAGARPMLSRVLWLACASLLAAACSSPAPTTFDLSAPRQRVAGGAIGGQVVVAEPTAIQTFEADRIIVKDTSGSVSFLGGAQWADRLPRLVQARLIQTFENSSRIRAVSRPGDRITADYQLNTELRAFQISSATNEAIVEISAKVVNDKTGRIGAARVFTARVPVATIDAPNAAQSLDKALSTVLLQIVRWVGSGGSGGQA
jgi:cholesterol transport system auxiliary component